jgi:predicted tellurium resistance membrane protein TerC
VLGAAVLERFRPVLLLFAGILLASSAKMLLGGGDEGEEEANMEDNAVVALVRRLLPVSPDYDGDAFFTLVDGVRTATPLLLVLVVIELSDLVFAVDSIPAVFGVTTDPFIVYTSNMFAIAVRGARRGARRVASSFRCVLPYPARLLARSHLPSRCRAPQALRALFPVVAGAMGELKYLEKAVSLVLGFIGAKMVADFGGYHISTGVSLAVVASALAAGVGLSLALPDADDKA